MYDRTLFDCEPAAAEEVLERADIAVAVIINLAISGIERVVREVRLALQRHRRERLMAMQAAERMGSII